MKAKKWLVGLLSILCVATSGVALAGCDNDEKQSSSEVALSSSSSGSLNSSSLSSSSSSLSSSDSSSSISSHKHTWNKGEISIEPTCTVEGEMIYWCFCGEHYNEIIPTIEHTYTILEHDAEKHWYECICGEKDGEIAHSGGTATCTEYARCSLCDIPYGTFGNHQYTALEYDAEKHWYECVCGEKGGETAHSGGTATCTEYAHCEICDTKYGKLKSHEYTTLECDNAQHWYKCSCGAKSRATEHSGGEATCTEYARCSVCDTEYGKLKSHVYVIKFDENLHWNECVCGKKYGGVYPHSGGTATCTQLARCRTCQQGYGGLKPHQYTSLKFDEMQHWNECVCGEKDGETAHSGGTATCTQLARCSVCNTEHGELKAHEYTSLKFDETQHWYECVCGEKDGETAHSGGEATCTQLARCSVCNTEHGELKAHEYTSLKSDETQHWDECVCGEKDGETAHTGGEATCTEKASCEVCQTPYGEFARHEWQDGECVNCWLEYASPNLRYTISDDQQYYILSSGKLCTDTEIVIPKTYEGLPVKEIGDSAFYGCKSIVKVFLPSSVTGINDLVFASCTSLTSIILPDSLTKLGEDVFSNCTSLENIVIPDLVESIGEDAFYGCRNLKNVTIGNSVKSIGAYAFQECVKLTDIVIPDSVTEIGTSAFMDCWDLTDAVIGDSVVSIGWDAFRNCYNLTNLTIGKSVQSIGELAFYSCNRLVTIQYNATECEDFLLNNEIFYKAGQRSDGIALTIGENVKTIPQYFFYPISESNEYTPKLKSLVFEEGSLCQTIGKRAFYKNAELQTLVLGESLKSIGEEAFYDCLALTEIEYKAVECEDCDGKRAFYNAGQSGDGIALTIGANVKRIPACLFDGGVLDSEYHYDVNITKIVFEEGSLCETIGWAAFRRCTNLTSDIILPDSITVIESSVFAGCSSLTNIYIGECLTSIGAGAFKNCTSLIGINIPESVTYLGAGAFYNCTNLTKIGYNAIACSDLKAGDYVFYHAGTIGEGIQLSIGATVKQVPAYLFEGLPKLKDVAFAEGSVCEKIGQNAFYKCTGLESISLPFVGASPTATSYDSVFGYIFGYTTSESKDAITGATYQYDGSTSSVRKCYYHYYIPETLKSVSIIGNDNIPKNAFYNCNNLTAVKIAPSIKTIEKEAFFGCDNITSVYIQDVASWCGMTFGDSPLYGANLYLNNQLVTELIIPNTVTSIADKAFGGCSSLTSVNIPESITSIGASAFSSCSSLTNIYYNAAECADFEYDDYVFHYAGQNSEELTLTVGKNVKNIPKYFLNNNNTGKLSVIFEQGGICTSIGEYTFNNCKNLTTIELYSVETIEQYAFSGCENLTNVRLSETLKSIGLRAFYNCQSLTELILPSSIVSIERQAFRLCSNLTSVTFQETEGWYYSSSATATSGTNIASTDLENTQTAATYIAKTYYNYYWKRK